VWSFDVSKQAFAAAAAHGCGMLWAVLMAKYTEVSRRTLGFLVELSSSQTHPLTEACILRLTGPQQTFGRSQEGASECAWYMVVFTVDTTVGVAVALYLHTLATAWAKRSATSPVAFPLPLIHTAYVPPPPSHIKFSRRVVNGCVR